VVVANAKVKKLKRSRAAAASDESGPAPSEPTWIKHGPLREMQARVKVGIAMPDGSVADDPRAAQLSLWPSVRLRMVFDPHYGGRDSRDTPWHKAAIAAAMRLGELAKPTWMVENIADKWGVPVLKPTAFSKEKAKALAARTLFLDGEGHTPWTVLRSGGALSVQYDASVVILDESVTLHLPPTGENASLLEKTLDELVQGVSFAYAGVGYGLAGWASALTVDRGSSIAGSARLEPYRRGKIEKIEATSPAMGADWLLWVGDRWRQTPQKDRAVAPLLAGAGRAIEQRGALARVSVRRPASPDDAAGAEAAKALAADLHKVQKKLKDLQTRELLRSR
jgi:hypothetical protein